MVALQITILMEAVTVLASSYGFLKSCFCAQLYFTVLFFFSGFKSHEMHHATELGAYIESTPTLSGYFFSITTFL